LFVEYVLARMKQGMAAFSMTSNGIRPRRRKNFSKHGVDFERAAQVLRDPLALTIPDEEHSETKVRWITLGTNTSGQYVVVVHTFEQLTDERARVRIISARRSTRAEIHAYEEQR